jgi:hypothetical protein
MRTSSAGRPTELWRHFSGRNAGRSRLPFVEV